MNSKNKKVTMHDVAQRAGVSYQTVSRVLNNSCNVSPATREKIEKAIADLKYVPNLLAQQLSKKERRVIGLVNVSRNLQAPSDVVDRLRHYALKKDYELLITLIDNMEKSSIDECISRLKAQLITRILINVPLESNVAAQIMTDNDDCNLVFMDVDPFSPVLNVSFNPFDGTMASIHHLNELGHRKVALIPGPDKAISSMLRMKSWSEGLKNHSMESVACVGGDWTAKSGYDAMMSILHQTRDFTAVLVANDQMALGAISALNICSLRVPEDISVVGYDNTNDSAFFHPPLTTVSLDRDLQCKIAIDKLISENESEVSAVLPTSLILRQSCAKAGKKGFDTTQMAASLREMALRLEEMVKESA